MNYQEAVQELATAHKDVVDREDFRAISFRDPEEKKVRLLEVCGDLRPSVELLPITFGSSRDFPFESTVIQISPAEYEAWRQGRLELPEGWDQALATQLELS